MRRFDVKVAVGLSALMLGLGAFRTWSIWTTDIFVSDEYGYISSALQGQVTNAVLGYRTMFAYTNNALFWLFNIDSIDRITALLPMYIALWNIIAVVSVWQTLRLLGYQPRVVGLTLIGFISLPAFLIPSLGFFTEGMALAFASLGVYLVVRYLKEESRFRGGVILFLAGSAFWLAMHTREPYVLFFLGLGLIPLASILGGKSWKVPLVAGLVCLIVAQGVVYTVQDPIAVETQQSFISFGQTFGMGPFLSFLGLIPPVVTQTTTEVTTAPVITTTTTTTTSVSGSHTTTAVSVITTTTTTTFTLTLPVTPASPAPPPAPIQATGILALLGISTVPNSIVIRSLLLVVVSVLSGYGVLLILPIVGAILILFEIIVRRRLGNRPPVILLAVMFLATLAGVTLTFANDPTYFGSQHYSTLLRFASTTLLAFPLLTAPVVDRLVRNKKAVYAAIGLMVILYGLTAPSILGAAVSNLESYNNPLVFQPPQYAGPTVLFRNYVLAHPAGSPFVAMGLYPGLYEWTPGLSARSDVTYVSYMNGTQLASSNFTSFYLFVQPGGFSAMQQNYPLLASLAYNALTGNSSAVAGFRPVSTIFDDSYGLMILVSRASA